MLSGGDKRFIELAKRWLDWGVAVTVMTPPVGYEVCQAEGLAARYIVISRRWVDRLGIIITYLVRTAVSVFRIPRREEPFIAYSTSDFFPDVIPALCTTWVNRHARWVAVVFHLVPHYRERPGNVVWNYLAFLAQKLSLLLMKRNADIIQVDNRMLRDALLQRGFSPGRVHLVENGIDIPFIEGAASSSSNRYTAAYIGRLHSVKGSYELVPIWKSVVQDEPEAVLAVVGQGESGVVRELEKQIKEEGMEKHVHLLGHIPTEEVYGLLKSISVFITPSHEEGWGISICEAMACRKPVVSYDLPIYREVFKGTVNAVAEGDYKGFAAEVLRLLHNPGERNSEGERNYRIASSYSWDEIAQKELKRLTEILA